MHMSVEDQEFTALWVFATNIAQANRVWFEPDCANLMERFIRRGLRNIGDSPPYQADLDEYSTSSFQHYDVAYMERELRTNPNKVLQAKLQFFIEEMASNGPGNLTSANFQLALARLCPLWPFC
jgi:hypothetical protein